MTKRNYNQNDETPAGFENILLPVDLVKAIKKLDPTSERKIDDLCLILEPHVFSAISELLFDPFQAQSVFNDLLFNYLDLGMEKLDTYYDNDIHGFFLHIRELMLASVSYIEKQKQKGGLQ